METGGWRVEEGGGLNDSLFYVRKYFGVCTLHADNQDPGRPSPRRSGTSVPKEIPIAVS
jgi:hypothetical protein